MTQTDCSANFEPRDGYFWCSQLLEPFFFVCHRQYVWLSTNSGVRWYRYRWWTSYTVDSTHQDGMWSFQENRCWDIITIAPDDEPVILSIQHIKMVCDLFKKIDVEILLPLHQWLSILVGYEQLNKEEKVSSQHIKWALIAVYAFNCFNTYDQFVAQWLHPEETVNKYLVVLLWLDLLVHDLWMAFTAHTSAATGIIKNGCHDLGTTSHLQINWLCQVISLSPTIMIT